MTVLAQLEPPRPSRDARTGVRKKLRLVTSAKTDQVASASVLVHDLSTNGLLVQSDVPFEPGETIQLQLPGTGGRQAVVVWSSGTFFGCSFEKPISQATVSAALLKALPGAPSTADGPSELSVSDADFADRLVWLRRERGWNIEQLANRLGVSRQAVWYWETGRRLPRPALFKRIAEAFAIEPNGVAAKAGQTAPADATCIVDELRREVAARIGCDAAEVRISIEF